MKSPFCKNILLGRTKQNRIKGLFEIFKNSTLMGYSVKIHSSKVSLRRFRKRFFEEFNELDEDYGNIAWDYVNKQLAIAKFEEL